MVENLGEHHHPRNPFRLKLNNANVSPGSQGWLRKGSSTDLKTGEAHEQRVCPRRHTVPWRYILTIYLALPWIATKTPPFLFFIFKLQPTY